MSVRRKQILRDTVLTPYPKSCVQLVMSDTIYIRNEQGHLHPLAAAGYENEAEFQELLAAHPDLLASPQMDPNFAQRWVLVDREFGIGDTEEGTRWALDLLFLDQEGIPTLVEVKRSTDSRIRRKVVGQMMDYAANAIRYGDVDTIRRLFDRTHANDPDVLEQTLKVADAEAYWDKVRDNLNQGRVRMVFVADRIPRELRRIVEFLNEQMRPAEVLAVAVQRYTDAENASSVFVPRVVGQTEAAAQKKGTSPQDYTRDAFFAELTSNADPSTVRAMQALCEHVDQKEGCDLQGTAGGLDIRVHGYKLFRMGPNGGVWTTTTRTRKFVDADNWTALVERAPEQLEHPSSRNETRHPQGSLAAVEDLSAWTKHAKAFIDWCAHHAVRSATSSG